MHQNAVNDAHDALGIGGCYVVRFSCSHESKFIPIEEFCTFSDEFREFEKHHLSNFCRNSWIGR